MAGSERNCSRFDGTLRVLFIGESWLGSCARSLKEALARRADIELDEVNEDAWFPRPRARWLRALNRVTAGGYRRELNAQILSAVHGMRPHAVMTYKGMLVHADLLAAINSLGPVHTVNVYPDCSPHAHGSAHRKAVGAYNLVVSTKAFHPATWHDVYGYRNKCVFVPQGYDPRLHLAAGPPGEFEFDVVMVATHRPEYERLLREFADCIPASGLRVAIGGWGWEKVRASLPADWVYPGGVQGRSYVSLLRSGKICIAPLTREMTIDGGRHPGDVDSTRTYELAAAHCFFVHRRTDFAAQLYSRDEVPMFDDGAELARQVLYYLPKDAERARMSAAAHRRAVPAYSMDARAASIVEILRKELTQGNG